MRQLRAKNNRVQSRAMTAKPALCSCLLVGVVIAFLTGCRPSSSNIALRKEKQTLLSQIEQLRRERDADRARLRSIERSSSTQPTVSQSLIERLYTAHGLRFSRVTGTWRATEGGASEMVVHVVPTDQEGQTLKAAGQFAVSIFDLSNEEAPLIGQREFTLEEARQAWHGQVMLFNYVLPIPLQREPQSDHVTVKVEFTDELTGRVITGEHKATVRKD